MTVMEDLTHRLVSCPKQFASLKTCWDDLFEASEKATVFISWDWLYTWWETFSECDSRDLFILCFYDQSTLVGIAPFQIERKYPHTYIQGRTLRFVGSGEAAEDNIATPFLDLLARDGYEDKLAVALEKALLAYQSRWDFAEFDYLLDDALVFSCFKQPSNRIQQQIYPYGYRYTVPQVSSQKAYLETLARRWQKDYRKKDRLFQKDGELEVLTVQPDLIDETFDLLKDMHRDRWSGRADFLVFESEKFSQFHRALLKRLAPQGKAYIRTLYLNGLPMSSYYAFEGKGQVHYYQSAFYKENSNRYMPLFYLVCNEIGMAMKQGKRFDFMFDDSAQSYKKLQYAAASSPMYRMVWTPSRYRLRVFNLYKSYKKAWARSKEKTATLRKKTSV